MTYDEAFARARAIKTEIEALVRPFTGDDPGGVAISALALNRLRLVKEGETIDSAGVAVPLVVVTVSRDRVGAHAARHDIHATIAVLRLKYSADTISLVFS